MSLIDSLGTLFEGGLFARAIEPKAGEGAPVESYAGACLNCGTERTGPHCHQCGQKAHVHRTMGEFFHDLLHGALHFEGKTFRTLPLLVGRPGQLTRRYIDGERARFVSPMALFLFSVFLMFAVFQFAGVTPPTDLPAPASAGAPVVGRDVQAELDQLREARAGMQEANVATRMIDTRIAALESQLADDAARTAGEPVVLAGSETGSGGRLTARYSGVEFIDHGIDKWRENPGLMAYKLQSNFYKFSWLLIPLSLPFVWLLFFWKRRFGMYDHAVFVTYSLSFMTLFFVALVLLGTVGLSSTVLGLAFVFVPLLHIYRQLKGTYQLSRVSALWRTAMLTMFIFVIVFLFVDLLLLIGAVA